MQSRILLRGYAREGGTPSLATHPQNQEQQQNQNQQQNQEQQQNQNQQQNQGRLHRGLDTPSVDALDPHIKVLLAIARCRTAALGGHIDECTRCGHRATISYNSCRNRHCPKCQTGARERWIQARRRELLPSPYVHVVFTLPSQLAALALQNKKIVYSLLLRASAETLLEVARNPTHLGAEIGFFSVLHTWNQKLQIHPHVHCVVAAGGLSLD